MEGGRGCKIVSPSTPHHPRYPPSIPGICGAYSRGEGDNVWLFALHRQVELGLVHLPKHTKNYRKEPYTSCRPIDWITCRRKCTLKITITTYPTRSFPQIPGLFSNNAASAIKCNL